MQNQKRFNDIANKYNLNYQYQEFENCYGGHWFVFTHSLYNSSGCFTIHCLPQRSEVDCYYAETFSNDREELCRGRRINVFETERPIWRKKEKMGILRNPFYYWDHNIVIETLIEVIEISIEKNNEFFGVKIFGSGQSDA